MKNPILNCRLEGKELEQVKMLKYSRTIFCSKGKIHEEINHVLGVTGKLYNLVKITFFGRKEVPKKIKTYIKKVVMSMLTHGSVDNSREEQKQNNKL